MGDIAFFTNGKDEVQTFSSNKHDDFEEVPEPFYVNCYSKRICVYPPDKGKQ